jgi:citrate synthase
MDELGIPQELYTAIFAAARIFGWWAHYMEQLNDNKLIRPSSEYTGPRDRKI